MKHFYYYMPPCPKCGSEATGRYVRQPLVGRDYMMVESLENGELIRFAKRVPAKNAFCADCGFSWREEPRVVRITDEERDDEAARRGTEKLLQKYRTDRQLDKAPKIKGLFSGWINFF